jgi:plasmid segregation protein ParM
MFPTAVIPSFTLHDEVAAHRARRDTVKVGSASYFVGETALVQGRLTSTPGLYENWVESPEHDALMLAGHRRAVDAGADEDALVVLGLPANLFSRQRDKMREHASRLLNTRVMVIPQPVGPFSELMLDERGRQKSAAALDSESWAVIEVGYFTTDFTLIQQGQWIEDKSTSCSGVRISTERLQRILSSKGSTATLFECESILRSKAMTSFGSSVDMTREVSEATTPLVSEIFDTASRLFSADARLLNGIIITGGGSDLVFGGLKERWPNGVQPQDPRFSVAEGMRRHGELKLFAESHA